MKEFQKRLLLEQQKQTKILQTIASSLEDRKFKKLGYECFKEVIFWSILGTFAVYMLFQLKIM